ncbi:MAG: hypothetical protein ABI743_03780 [bacterium]
MTGVSRFMPKDPRGTGRLLVIISLSLLLIGPVHVFFAAYQGVGVLKGNCILVPIDSALQVGLRYKGFYMALVPAGLVGRPTVEVLPPQGAMLPVHPVEGTPPEWVTGMMGTPIAAIDVPKKDEYLIRVKAGDPADSGKSVLISYEFDGQVLLLMLQLQRLVMGYVLISFLSFGTGMILMRRFPTVPLSAPEEPESAQEALT